MKNNIAIRALKSIFLDWIGEILYFPLWWYSRGLVNNVVYVGTSIKNSARDLALPLMLKNIFKPMYGQYDRQGRFISFIMRVLLIFSRLIVFLFLFIGYLIILLFWIVFPIIVFLALKNNLSILWSR